MSATKKPVNAKSAAVMLQVARRFGQRTWRSSSHAPLKYPPIALKGFLDPVFLVAAGVLAFASLVLTFGFGAVSLALTRTTVDCDFLVVLLFVGTVCSQIKSLLEADCQVPLYSSVLMRSSVVRLKQ